jgi:hypothetical protein
MHCSGHKKGQSGDIDFCMLVFAGSGGGSGSQEGHRVAGGSQGCRRVTGPGSQDQGCMVRVAWSELQALQELRGSQGGEGSHGLMGLMWSHGLRWVQGLRGIAGGEGVAGVTGVEGPHGSHGVRGTQGVRGHWGSGQVNARSCLMHTQFTLMKPPSPS